MRTGNMERKYIGFTEQSKSATFGGENPTNRVLVPLDLIDLIREDPLGCRLFLAGGQTFVVCETFKEVRECLG